MIKIETGYSLMLATCLFEQYVSKMDGSSPEQHVCHVSTYISIAVAAAFVKSKALFLFEYCLKRLTAKVVT